MKMEKIVSRGIRMVAESADAQMKANVKLWKKEMAEHPTWKGMLRDLMKCKDELAKAEEDLIAIREEKAYNDYNTWYYLVLLVAVNVRSGKFYLGKAIHWVGCCC